MSISLNNKGLLRQSCEAKKKVLDQKLFLWVTQNFLGVSSIFFGPLVTNKQTKTKQAFDSLLLKFGSLTKPLEGRNL